MCKPKTNKMFYSCMDMAMPMPMMMCCAQIAHLSPSLQLCGPYHRPRD